METDNVESTPDNGSDSTEYVELHEADDADLDAFLENADQADSLSQPVEQPKAEEPAQEEQEPQKQAEDPTAQLAAKIEAMQKQLQGQELLLKRRTSEIAAIKQKLEPLLQVTQQQLDDLYLESPAKAMQVQLAKTEAEKKLAELSAEEQQLVNQQQAQTILSKYVGPDGMDVQAVAETLAQDGLPPEFIQQFVANPYRAALPETLIHLAKRAEEKKRADKAEMVAAQLYYYLQRVMDEAKQAPNKALANIQNAMKSGPSVTAASATGGQRGFNPDDISSLSEAELDELLKAKN